MKTYFDHGEFKKGDLNSTLKDQERQLREIRREEEQTGLTTSRDDDPYFIKKGE